MSLYKTHTTIGQKILGVKVAYKPFTPIGKHISRKLKGNAGQDVFNQAIPCEGTSEPYMAQLDGLERLPPGSWARSPTAK